MGWRGLLSREYSKQIRSDRKAARPEGLTDDHLSLRAECVFFNGAYLPYSVDALPLLQSRTLGDAVQNKEGTHDYNGRRRFGRGVHADHNGGRGASDRDDVEDFIDLGSGHSDSELFSEDRSRRDDLYGDDYESRSDGSEVADSYVRPKAPETSRKRGAGRKRSTAPQKKNRRKTAHLSRIESKENIGSISCASFLPPPFLCKVVDVKKALKAYADTVPIETICDIVLGRHRAESTSGDARSETSSDSYVSLVDSAITHRAPTDASIPVRTSVIVETMEKITTFVKALGAESSDSISESISESSNTTHRLVVDDFRMTGRTRDGVSEESIKQSLRQAFEQYFDGTHDMSIEILEARKEVHHWITKLARRVQSRSDWAARGNSCGYWTLLFHEVDRRARNYLRCDLFHLQKRQESEHDTRCREFDKDALDAEVQSALSVSSMSARIENFEGATFDARSVVKDQLVLLFFAREPKDLVQMFNDRDLASLQHIRDSAGLSMIDLFDSHMVQPVTLQDFDFTTTGSSDARFLGERRYASDVVWVSHAVEMCVETLDTLFGEGGFPGTTFEEAVDAR
eukprot:gene17430-20751_t